MSFSYVHPPVDNVRADYQVDVLEATDVELEEVETVGQAIEVYLRAFSQKFHSQMGRKQRKLWLQYIQRY